MSNKIISKGSTSFSPVRTDPELKKQVQEVLKELGLSWGIFVNNAAKQLVIEKKVVFELRDSEGFTPQKGNELKTAMKRSRSKCDISSKMSVSQAQKYLSKL